MEKYSPKQDDFTKAEELMSNEQRKKSETKDSLMANDTELKEDIILSAGESSITTRNIKDILELLEKGYSPNNFSQQRSLIKIGININEINQKRELEILKRKFELNEKRELIYLKNGYDEWMENVKNYWYNKEDYEGYGTQEIGPKREIKEKIDHGINQIMHQDSKDLATLSLIFQEIMPKIESLGFLTDELKDCLKYFQENVSNLLLCKVTNVYKSKCTPDLQPKNKEKMALSPLLEPFIAEIKTIEAQGDERISDWLLEQAEMAGISAAYQDIYPKLKIYTDKLEEIDKKYQKFITENKIQGAPLLPKLTHYLNKLEFIHQKIHRI